jgi:hypothetical protein
MGLGDEDGDADRFCFGIAESFKKGYLLLVCLRSGNLGRGLRKVSEKVLIFHDPIFNSVYQMPDAMQMSFAS